MNQPTHTHTINSLLKQVKKKQIDLATHCNISPATISLITARGQWPSGDVLVVRLQASITTFFMALGIGLADITAALRNAKLAKTTPPATPATPETPNPEEENIMLLKHESLLPDTMAQFKLNDDPFNAEIRSIADLYFSPEIRHAAEKVWNIALTGGFGALVGESGSGKSTLRQYLHERIKKERAGIIVIEPYVLAMEENDNKGKTLKAAAITEAIIRTLSPSSSLKSSPEARSRQLHDLLRASHQTGNRHLLVIEEAHALPPATLKHLKRFRELTEGFTPLLGVLLIGQQELGNRLKAHNPDVREVVQRIDVFGLPALDKNLEGYIKHKLARVGAKPETIFDGAVYEALRARLTHQTPTSKKRDDVSVCYPLVVNNLVSRAMNCAMLAGVDRVTPEVILEAV